MQVSGQHHISAILFLVLTQEVAGWVPRASLGILEDRKISLSCQDSNPGLSSLQPSCYTNYAMLMSVPTFYCECSVTKVSKAQNVNCSSHLGIIMIPIIFT